MRPFRRRPVPLVQDIADEGVIVAREGVSPMDNDRVEIVPERIRCIRLAPQPTAGPAQGDAGILFEHGRPRLFRCLVNEDAVLPHLQQQIVALLAGAEALQPCLLHKGRHVEHQRELKGRGDFFPLQRLEVEGEARQADVEERRQLAQHDPKLCVPLLPARLALVGIGALQLLHIRVGEEAGDEVAQALHLHHQIVELLLAFADPPAVAAAHSPGRHASAKRLHQLLPRRFAQASLQRVQEQPLELVQVVLLPAVHGLPLEALLRELLRGHDASLAQLEKGEESLQLQGNVARLALPRRAGLLCLPGLRLLRVAPDVLHRGFEALVLGLDTAKLGRSDAEAQALKLLHVRVVGRRLQLRRFRRSPRRAQAQLFNADLEEPRAQLRREIQRLKQAVEVARGALVLQPCKARGPAALELAGARARRHGLGVAGTRSKRGQ
mmetsp:Transcript_9321/g.34892  ORF Transcript_9321/g.34892 Transcript_9321/m.34892 type:complete len:438 (-) Transcript_9321:30-1343(-)